MTLLGYSDEKEVLTFLFIPRNSHTSISHQAHKRNLEQRLEHKTMLTESHLAWEVPDPFHFLSSQSVSTTELLQSCRYESQIL